MTLYVPISVIGCGRRSQIYWCIVLNLLKLCTSLSYLSSPIRTTEYITCIYRVYPLISWFRKVKSIFMNSSKSVHCKLVHSCGQFLIYQSDSQCYIQCMYRFSVWFSSHEFYILAHLSPLGSCMMLTYRPVNVLFSHVCNKQCQQIFQLIIFLEISERTVQYIPVLTALLNAKCLDAELKLVWKSLYQYFLGFSSSFIFCSSIQKVTFKLMYNAYLRTNSLLMKKLSFEDFFLYC